MSTAPAPARTATLPATGVPAAELLARVRAGRQDDADWRSGRIFSLVYHAGDERLEDVLAQVAREYLAENALNPRRFPSLARMERDVADIVAGLLHGSPGTGGLTSGGTESIFLAVYVARERARARGVQAPNLVASRTAHPAFRRACHVLQVEHRRAEVGPDRRADPAALARLVDDRTALVVASAPSYPYGVVDRVPEVAAIAADAGTLCHVDACLGGLLLPFWERLGEPVAPWDFRVPGVTSISADLHKYGYAFKGASALLWRDAELYGSQWWFDDGEWGGGVYASPTSAGTRPAPPIAGAWAALHALGEQGYLELAGQVRVARDALLAGLEGIADLRPTVPPDLSVLEVCSDELDLMAVADALEERGWYLDRQPGGLHLMLSPFHATVVGDLLAALRAAVEEVRAGRTALPAVARYGAAPPR